MGDDKGCAVVGYLLNEVSNRLFTFIIQSACRFIKNDNGWDFLRKNARNTQPLLLPPG